MAQTMPAVLPWESHEEEIAAVAAGQVCGAQVLHWQALAKRVEHAHAGGYTVLHHWVPTVANSLPPVVLFHGGSGSWTHWVRSIGPLLQAGHEVWAVDLPGFGASDAPPNAVDADDLLPVLAEMLQAVFRGQPIRLVGFSFGGMTACMLAAAFPHLVAQLVMVGAPGMGLGQKKAYRLKGWRHLSDPLEQLQTHIHNLQALMFYGAEAIDRDCVALHVHNVRRDNLPRRRISSTDIVLQSLLQVQCPVAAIYGAFDALYPDRLQEVKALMAARTRDWQGMECVQGAGHWVQYEKPDAFHAVLLPLLAAHP